MNDKLLFSIAEAATALGLGRTSVYNFINSGDLKTVKLGTRTLIKVSSLEALINKSEKGAAE